MRENSEGREGMHETETAVESQARAGQKLRQKQRQTLSKNMSPF